MPIETLHDLAHGMSVALSLHNLGWCFAGVLLGNLVGVLPGLGPMSAISLLLPLTYALGLVPSMLMLAGIFYGAQYGGAIGAILLNLPCHPPHAVTCLDGYPLTRAGKGGTALCIAMLSSFCAASFGIVVMIFAAPLLVSASLAFGPPELCALMVLGLLAGAGASRGSTARGLAMMTLGLLIGLTGSDVNSGMIRFGFGIPELSDNIDLVALSLGVFGIAEFLLNADRPQVVTQIAEVRIRDMRPSRAELRQAWWPMVRGTLVGTFFGAIPGTGPTISSFVAYTLEQRVARGPVRPGHGAIAGVASPEAAAHAKTQVDFIPTMTLGIPGDPVMALLIGALLIHNVVPGPQLISEHADLFWGLIGSFWIGNLLLIIFNVPLIGLWVRLLRLPYRWLFPLATLFIAIGVFSINNSLFDVGETLFFGVVGAVLIALRFPVAPLLLGYVLGPLLEENFRRTMTLFDGHLGIFVERPISAGFLGVSAVLVAVRLLIAIRPRTKQRLERVWQQ